MPRSAPPPQKSRLIRVRRGSGCSSSFLTASTSTLAILAISKIRHLSMSFQLSSRARRAAISTPPHPTSRSMVILRMFILHLACSPALLVHSARTGAGLVLLHEEGERHHHGTSQRKRKDHIVVGQSSGLPLHLSIHHAVRAL